MYPLNQLGALPGRKPVRILRPHSGRSRSAASGLCRSRFTSPPAIGFFSQMIRPHSAPSQSSIITPTLCLSLSRLSTHRPRISPGLRSGAAACAKGPSPASRIANAPKRKTREARPKSAVTGPRVRGIGAEHPVPDRGAHAEAQSLGAVVMLQVIDLEEVQHLRSHREVMRRVVDV